MKTRSLPFVTIWLSLVICSGLLPTARADVLESARMLPGDMAMMISVESVSDLRAALEKTSFYELYQDPAIQQVVRPAVEKIRAQLDEAIKDFWQKSKIENPPEQIPYPEGRLVLGLSLAASDGRTDAPAPGRSKAPGVQVRLVLLADLGDRAPQALQAIRALSAAEAG
ncbi:MAG: hypothetical protein FJ280_22190, partial [Planctomycetes bacterium]|nr:hypothetical protein [Planctomycetota bacterium]